MNWEVQGSTEIMFALFICAIIHTYLSFFLPLCCSCNLFQPPCLQEREESDAQCHIEEMFLIEFALTFSELPLILSNMKT